MHSIYMVGHSLPAGWKLPRSVLRNATVSLSTSETGDDDWIGVEIPTEMLSTDTPDVSRAWCVDLWGEPQD